MNRRHRPHRAAFTLIELIAAMVVLTTLGSAAAIILFNVIDGYISAGTHAQLHAEADVTMERIVSEVRDIDRREGGGNVAPAINGITADSITWHDDHSLVRDGDRLLLSLDGSTHTLSRHVEHFAVRAFDDNNEVLEETLSDVECRAVRRLEFRLTLARHDEVARLRTRVWIRSLMEEGR